MAGNIGIPYVVLEEHHEAFYYWSMAVERGYLSPEGNTLFHVDHHDDMEAGGYSRDFTRPFGNLEERREFTYWKLGIADFIAPALYEGWFSAFYNMKGLITKDFKGRERFVKRIGRNTLKWGDYIPFLHGEYRRNNNEEYRFFNYYEGSLAFTGELEKVILDIDLDYFCWDDSLSSVPPKRIEITREAFEQYQNDPFHPFRILPRSLLVAEEVGGRCYLRYQEPVVEEKKADRQRVGARIEKFFHWLGQQSWQPALITLCRSAHSGYLPAEQAGYVEEQVRANLQDMYDLEEII